MTRRSILSVQSARSRPLEARNLASAHAMNRLPKPATKVKPSRSQKAAYRRVLRARRSDHQSFSETRDRPAKDQQEMLFEAIADFVAKHQAASAFRVNTPKRPGL